MKSVAIIISFIFCSSVAFAQMHQPTWKFISDQNISSFDMLTTRSGLIGIDDNGVRILSIYSNDTISGVFSASGSITSIIIRDIHTAYFTVQGDGIYQAGNGWKDFTLLSSIQNPFLLDVLQTNILANFNAALNLSTDGASFIPAKGISSADTIKAAQFFSTQTAVAVTGRKLYRSLDGGRSWFVVLDTLQRTNSIYIDHTHNAIYIGGSQCMKSLDSGKTWQTLSNIFFTLAGPVIGTHDCSGTFYIAPDSITHGEIYRSTSEGSFFQDAGSAIFTSLRLKKGVVLDRGSTFFWLDKSGLLTVVRDGIDSVITDSVRSHLFIQSDSGVSNSLCPNAAATQFGVSLTFDQCTAIILDSLIQITPQPEFIAKFIPGPLGDSLDRRVACSFRATRAGFDTVHYRLKFHSPITANIEQKFFDVIGVGIPGSPLLNLTSGEVNFPATGLDSINSTSISLTNPGCDILRIDTIFSTNPAIFIFPPKIFPIKLAPGKSIELLITFHPHLSGDYLESLVIETNAGNRNITLRGRGKTQSNENVSLAVKEEITLYPNPAGNIVTISSPNELPKDICVRDLLGRQSLMLHTGGGKTFICDLQSLADGLYVLDCGGGKLERIIVRH